MNTNTTQFVQSLIRLQNALTTVKIVDYVARSEVASTAPNEYTPIIEYVDMKSLLRDVAYDMGELTYRVWYHCQVEMMKRSEVAEKLKVSPKTVAYHYRKFEDALSERLHEAYGESEETRFVRVVRSSLTTESLKDIPEDLTWGDVQYKVIPEYDGKYFISEEGTVLRVADNSYEEVSVSNGRVMLYSNGTRYHAQQSVLVTKAWSRSEEISLITDHALTKVLKHEYGVSEVDIDLILQGQGYHVEVPKVSDVDSLIR